MKYELKDGNSFTLNTNPTNENKLITQSNLLTLSKSDLNLIEKKIFFRLLEILNPIIRGEIDKMATGDYSYQGEIFNDVGTLRIRMSTLGVESSNYKQLMAALKSLQKRTIEIDNEEMIMFTSSVLYSKHERGSEFVNIGIHNELYKFIFNVSEGYTLLELKTVLSLGSVHAIKLYELLCKWRNKKQFYIPIEKLRFLTNTELKYPRLVDFKKYVLDQAKSSLDSNGVTDLRFTYTQEKKGRTVTGFYINVIHTSASLEVKKLIKSAGNVSVAWHTSPAVMLFLKDLNINVNSSSFDLIKQLAIIHPSDEELLNKLESFELSAKRIRASNVAGYVLSCIKKYLANNTV